MVRLSGSTASLPQKEENSTPRFPTPPFMSSLNPLRELLNTVLRELGEKPYFADANTAAIPAIRGPRKSERSSASGYLNCTNVPSNFTAGDFEVETNIGESYKKNTNHHAERPHTPNYNFLKQHLLDLTNWCLARGSHYDRLDAKDAKATPIFDGNANISKSSTKSSPQSNTTTEGASGGAEELAITYWDPETVYAVLYTIATIVRRVDDVGVYSPAASFASPNLKERLLSGVVVGKESTTDKNNTNGRRKSTTGDTMTSARTTQSLLSLDFTDGGQSALANDDTGLAYIAPLRLCTPSEVLHLLHMCAEAATCFTVVASSQLDMPQVMLRVYSIDPKLNLSANPEANRQTLLNSVSNIPHHCSKTELAVLRGQMRRTAELFCAAFATALLSHAPHQAAPKNSRAVSKLPNNNANTSLTLPSDSADAKREPKSLYFMWLMYKTLSEALHGGNGMGGGNLDSVYFGSLGGVGGSGGDSPFPNPLQSANHHDPLSTTMRTRSRSTGLDQGGSAGNRASSPSTDLQTFFEEIRRAIYSQEEVESVLSPLRRRSIGPNSAPTIPLGARSSPTVTGFNARRRAGSRRLHSGPMVEYRHPQYYPLLAELLSALCAFWKKQAYSLVKEVLAPSEGRDAPNPLLIGERNARLQQEAEQRRDAAYNARYSTKPSGGKRGEETGTSAAGGGCVGPSAVRTRGMPPALPTTRYGVSSSSSSTALQTPSTSASLTAVSSRLQLYERLLAAEQRRQEELLSTARDGDANLFERSLLEGPAASAKAGTGGRNKNVAVEDVAESVAYKSSLAAGTELTATVGSVKSSTIQDFFAPRQRITAFAKEMLAEIHLEARGSVQTDATASATDTSLISGLAEPKYVPMSQREPLEHEPEEEMVKRLSSITNMGRSLGDLYATLDSNALLSIKREFVAIREAEEKSMPAPANRRFFKQPTTRHTLASNANRAQKAANKASASEIAEAKKRSLLPAQFSWVSGGELKIKSAGTPTAARDSAVPAAATAIAAAASAASNKKDGKKGGVTAASPVISVGQVDAPRFFLIRSPDTPLSGDFRGRHTESTPLGAKPTAGAFSANSTITTINGSTVSLPLPASDEVPNFIKAVTKVAANAQLGINPPPATAAELLRVINKEDLPLGLIRLKAAIVGHNASSLFLASLHAERFCYAQALHSMHAKLSTIENAYERRRVEREWVSTLAAEVGHAVNVCRYQHLDLLVEVIEADLEANVHPNEESVTGTLPNAPARAVSLLVDPATAAADPTERLFVDLLRQRLQVDNLGFASKRLHAHRYFTPVSFVLESTLRQMLSPILLVRLQRAVFRFRRLGGGVPSSLVSPASNTSAYGGSSSNATVPVGSAMNHPAYSADAAMFETFGQPANIIAFALLLRDDAFGTVKPSTTPVASPRRRRGAAANNAAPKTADAFAPPLVPEELRDVFLSLWEVVAHTFMKHNKIIGYRSAKQEEKAREEKHAADAREMKKEASWRCFSGLQSRTSSFQKPRSEDASAHTAAGAGDGRSGSTPISCGDGLLPPVHPVVATPLNILHVSSPPSSARSDYATAAFNTLPAKRQAHRLQEDADFLKIEATKKQRCLGTILWLLVSLSHYMVGDSRGHHAAPLIGVLQCSHRCFPLVIEMLDYALCVKSEVLILLRKIEEEKLQLRNGHESVVSPAAAHIMNLAGSVNVVVAGASGSTAGSPIGGGLSGSGFNRSRQSSNAAALDIDGSPRFSSGSAPAAAFDAGLGYTPAPKMSKPQGPIPNTVGGGDNNTIFGALESKPTRRAAYNALLVPQMALYEQLLLVQGIVHHGLEVSDLVLSTFSNRHLHSNNVYSHNFFYLSKKATGSYDGSGLRTGVGRGLGFASNSAHTPLGAGGRSATTRPFLDSATDPMASAREVALAEKIARLIRPTVENQIHAILSLVFLQHSSNSVAAGIASHTRSILLAFTPGAHHMQVAQQMSAAAAASESGDANVTSARTAERDTSSKGANNSNPSTTATSTINEHTTHSQQQAGGDPALGSGNNNIRLSVSDAFGPNAAAMQSQSHLVNNATQTQQNDAQPKQVNAHRDPFNMGADAASSLAHSDTDSEEGDEMAELRRGLLELKARMQPYIDDQRRVDGDLNSSLRDLSGILEKYRQATSTAASGAGGGVAGSTFYWPQGMPSAMLDSMNYVSETAWLASEMRGFADGSDCYTNPTPHNAYPTPSHDASDAHHTVEDSRGDAIGSDYSEDPSSNAQGLDVPSVLTDFGYISLYLLPLPLLYLHQVRLIRHYRCVHKYYSQRLRVWLMGRQRRLEMKGRIRVASAEARQKRRRQRAERREAEASAESALLASSAKGSTQRRTSSPGNVDSRTADRSWRRRQSIDTQPPSSAATSFRRAPAATGGAAIEEAPQSPGGTLRIADMSFTTALGDTASPTAMSTLTYNKNTLKPSSSGGRKGSGGADSSGSDAESDGALSKVSVEVTLRNLGSTASAGHLPSIVNSTALLPTTAQLVKVINDRSFREKRKMRMIAEANRRSRLRRSNSNSYVLSSGASRTGVRVDEDDESSETTDDDYADALEQPLFVLHDFAEHERLQDMAQINERSARGTESNASSTFGGAPPSFYHTDHPLDFLLDPYLGCSMVLLSASASYLDDDQGQPGDSDDDESGGVPTDMTASSPLLPGGGGSKYMDDSRGSDKWAATDGKSSSPFGEDSCVIGQNNGRPLPIGLGRYGVPLTAAPTESVGYTVSEIKRRLVQNYTIINNNFTDYEGLDRVIQMNEMFVHQKHNFRSVVLLLSHEMLQLVEDSISMCQRPTAVSASSPADASGAPAHNNINSVLMTTMTNGVSNSVPGWMRVSAGGNPQALAAQQAKNAGGAEMAASSASPDRGSMGLSMNPDAELRSSFSLSFAANNGAGSPLSAARSGVFDSSAREHSPNRAGHHGGGESTTVAHDVSLMIANPQLEETSMLSHAYSPIMARPKWKVAYFRFIYVLFLQQYHSKAFLFAKRERAKAGTVPAGGASSGVAVGGGRSAASEGGLGATTRTTLANLSHIDASNLSHVSEGVRKGKPAANNDVSSSSDEEDARKPSTCISPAISTSNTPERQKINTHTAHRVDDEDLEAVSPRSHVERSSSYTEPHFKGLRALLDSDPMVKSNFIVERQVANEIKTLRRRHNRSYYRCWDVLIPRQQMLVGKFTERMVTFLLSAIRLMVELDDENCFVLQPRKGPEEAMSARPTRGRSTEEGCAAGFSLERVSLRDKAYKLGIVPTLTKEIDLENTLHEYQHRQIKRRNRSATLASSSVRARALSMSPSKMTSLFPPASPQKGPSSSRNEFESDVNSFSNTANNSRSGDNEALATEDRVLTSMRIDAATSRTSPSAPAGGVPKIPSLTFPLPAPQSPRNAQQTPTSARGGLPPLHPMSSRGTPRLAGLHALSPRLNMGSPRGALQTAPAPAPVPTKPKLPFSMPKLALNLAPPPIYYTSSGDTAAAAEGQLSVEQGQIDVLPRPVEAPAPAPAPTKPKLPFSMPKLALNLAPPPIYYTSSGDTAAAAEGQLSNESANFASPQSNVSLNTAFSPTPTPSPVHTSSSPAPAKPKLPFSMPKLALNLAPPPIYYTSSGDTAAAAEGQLNEDLTMHQQTAWPSKPVAYASPNSSPLRRSPSMGSSPPAPAKPKLPFAMPKLALNLAPPPIYYTSSGDTAAAAEGQLGEDLSLFKQQTDITGPFGSMSPMRAASVATTVSPSEPPSIAASPPKLPFAMPKLALNRAPPPIYYTSSGDTAAAAEGQLSNEAATFAMPEFGNKGQQQQQPARPASVPPVQIRKLALGSLSLGSRDSDKERDTKKEGTPQVAQRSPRVVSVIGEPVSTVVAHGSSPLEAPSPNKPKIPLIPILKPPSQQDPNSAPNSVSARGEQVSARGATSKSFSHPLIIKKLQIAPHPQVVDPQSEGTDDEGGVSARGGGDYFGAASPRSAMPGMGDLTKEERTSFQGFVASEALNSEEETLAELLGTNISPSSPAARAHQSPSIFVPSALVSDRERKYGTSSASASASYAPLEQVRRSSVSLIGPLIADDGPGFRSSGQGAVVASRDTNSVVAGGYAHSQAHSVPNSGFARKASSLAHAMSPRSGGLLNSQLPRAASVVSGQYRSSQFGRSESVSSSPLAAAQGGGVCGTFVADRGTFPVQLLMDTNAFMRHHRRTSRPIYASLHVHAQVLYLLMALLLRGLSGTSNPIIHPSANIKPGRRGPYYHSMGAASRNNATCGTLDERYSAAFSNLINNPANSAGVAVGGLGGGQNVLHPLHKHINHPLNQPAVRHLNHLIQSENLNQGLAVLMRLLTACGQSEGIDGLPAPVLGRLYMGLDSSNQGQTASSATGASFVGAPLVPYNASVNSAEDDRRHSGSAPNTPSTPQLLTATGRTTNEAPSLLLTAPPLSDLHKHRGTSTVVNIPMGAKMIGKGGYGTVLASNVAVVYSSPNDALPNPSAAPLNPEQLADQALFHHFVGAYLFGDNTNNLAVINSQPVVSANPEIVSVGFGVDHGRHSMSFPLTPSTTVVDPKTGATKTPSLVSLPIAVKLIAVPTFAEDRCALYSLHSEVLIMLRAQDGGRYRTGNVLNAPLVGNPAPNNCSELLDFGCSGNQYYVIMKRYPTSVKDWRERLVWESTHLVKGRRSNLNIEVSESLVEKALAAQQKEAAESRREALGKARRAGRRTSESGGGGGTDKLDATAGTMSPHTSGNVSSAEEGDGTLSSAESSSEESFDSDDSFAETRSERKRREVRREKERLAEKIRDQIFDTHKKASDDVLWLAATNPPPVEEVSNLSPEVAAEAAKQSLISGKPKPHAAVPEVKNPVLATMFPVLAHLFIQMLDTILALHQRSSTIHYDIKCDNFFLDFSDCGDRETEDLVKETLASAGAGGGSSKLFNSMMGGEDLDPVTIAARDRLERLNQWAEEGLMMATVPGADGTLPQGNMVKVRLGDFGESYINSKFAVRQAVNAQTQKARLERYWRLLEEQKKAISKIRQSVKMGKTELSTDDDEDSPTRIADDGDLSDDLTDHFITNVQTTLNNAISNAAARGEFVADDDRYESASDEGGNDAPVEDRRHSSDPDTDPDDLPATNDQFEMATKRATQVFVNQTPVPSLGIGFRQDMNPYARRMSMHAQFAPPMSARSGSGNRSSHDGALSARFNYGQRYGAGTGGSSTTGDSPTITTPTTSIGSGVMAVGGGGGLPPAMHLRLNQNVRSSPVNNRNTPLSARLGHQGSAPTANVPSSRSKQRAGSMILHLALAQTARNPVPFGGGGAGSNSNNNNGSNGSIPNSARYAPAPSARYGYSANNYNALPSARNGGNKASATSKLDKRYARGTEIIRPPELLLPHKFLADRRRRTHRTGYESDIWAVGCLLYELLTGDFLFYENLFPKMLARVANHDEPLMEDSHREMLNNDTDIINFLHFVLTRDPQRRPLLTEVRRRFVLLAQKKLSQQFSNVRKYLRITNPTANEDHIKRLAGALGFSAKIPTVLTKAMLLPVECRRNVLKWTLEHYDGEERERRMQQAKAKAAASASATAASTGTSLATALMSLEGSASERRDAQSPSPIKVGSALSSPTGTAAPVSRSGQRGGFSDDDEICEVSVSPVPPTAASEESNRRPSIPSLSIATMLSGGEKNNTNKSAAHVASSGNTNTYAANALSTAPQALRTFHTFIIHSLLVNEALPLYKAWRGALVANRLGLTGVCLPVAENDGSNTIPAVAQGHRYQQAKAAAQNNGSMTSRTRATANTTDFYLNAAAAHLAASSSSGLMGPSTSHTFAPAGGPSSSASASDPSGLVADLSANPLISDDAVESILESAQGYGLAATVSAQRVNGYKRDAMVGARGWEAIEKEKAIAAAAAEFSFGASATASPLNNVISAASVPDALYGASPIINVTNLISILANSYLILGLETDDADAAIPDLPTAEDFMAAGIFDEDDNMTNHDNTSRHFDDLQPEDLCFDHRDGGYESAGSGSEDSLANSVVSELQDNARHMNMLSSPPYGEGPRYVFPPSSVKNSFSVHVNASGAVPFSSSTAAGPRAKLTPEMISAMHSTKYSSSSAASLSVRTLQQHGITHVLSFGPLPGVAKHFHYLDMSPFLSRYEAEAAAIKTAVENGTFEQMMHSYTQQMNANANALHKSGADANINNGSKSARGVAPNPFGMSASLFAAAAAAQNNGNLSSRGSSSPLYGASANIKKSMAGGGDTREEQIASRLRPLHNAFVSWMVHGSSRTFCEHAASICGRVLVVPMIVMPTSVPRWVPMPLNIVCTPDASNEALYSGCPASTTNPCAVASTSVKPSALGARLSTSPADHGTSNNCSPNLQSRAMNANANNSPSTAALAGASPSPTSGYRLSAAQQKRLSINSACASAATAPPTHSVDMTLVWLLVYLTQTHRLPIITAMAHISNLCPILFQPQPQHRYLIDASSDAYTSRAVNGLGVATPTTVATATQQIAAGHQQQEPQLNGSNSPQQANSPLRRGRQNDGDATTSFVPASDAANASAVPQIIFVRAAAPVVIDPLQCIQAAVSILELYRMLTPAEFAMLGVVTPPPIYQLMCGPSELPAPGCATPLFGALGGNQSVRDRTALLMGLAFKEMYTAFEKKARGLVRNHMALGTPSLKASLPYADSAALWGLVIKFVAKHVLSDEGTASAPRPMKPCPDDPLMTKEERKRINKAAALYSPITLKLRMLWHRCLCAATLYPSVEISPSHSFFREGRTPLFASEHSVATQKLVLFDRNPAPIPVDSPSGNVVAPFSPTASRRSLGPKARLHTHLVKHARWLVNESILPFAAKTRYVHGEVAVRTVFPSASTAACALAPQSNLLRCGSSIFSGSSGGASAIRTPYSVKLTPSPNPDTVQWQAVPRKPTQTNEKDKPFSPAFTILVCAMEGFLQQESIAAKRRESMRSREGAAAQYQNHRAAAGSTGEIVVGTDARGSIYHAFGSGSISASASTTPSTTSPSPMRSAAALRPSEGGDVASSPGAAPSAFDPATADIEPTDFAVITNVAIALSEVVLAALNALCAFPDALANLQQLVTSVGAPPNHVASASPAATNANAGDGHIYACRHCSMPTHVRLPNDLRGGKDLTKEERDAEAEEGSIVTTRTYAVCPQGLALATAANCNILDPLLQSWYVHQHMHPRPE